MNILMTGAVGDVGQTLVARMKMVKLNNRLANTIICAAVHSQKGYQLVSEAPYYRYKRRRN